MIPSTLVYLNAMPLTPNGKIDRGVLPAPDRSRPELEESYVAPRDPNEEILAGIWGEILKVDKVGMYDNFFDLGGHSLLATQVVSRVDLTFQVDLSLRDVFENPTVDALAERIEKLRRRRKDREAQFPPIPSVSREWRLPLSFSQQRLWFLDQLEPNSPAYQISSTHRLRGPLDVGALSESLNEIVRRHEALRTTFSNIGGQAFQKISTPPTLPLPLIDLGPLVEAEADSEIRRLVDEEIRRGFDLERGPLVRNLLLRLGSQDHVWILNVHHIVFDGWSMGIFLRELSLLYGAFTKSEASPLHDLPIQYVDYAVWQRQWLHGAALDNQLSYWRAQLANLSTLQIPMDYSRPPVPSCRGGRQSLTLSKELADQLKTLSRREGVTLFMTLLAAFQTLLHRYAGQDDIAVGSPIANRTRTEIEGLIGFFVNTLVLRANFSGSPTFKELLSQVKESALSAYAHQDLPFEKLVEEMHPTRSLNHTPLFQVLFNMADKEDATLDLRGLEVERIAASNPESKFDVTLYAREHEHAIGFNLVYRLDLFDEARMSCFLQQYKYLLEQIVTAPQQSVQSYSLVTPESRSLLPDPSAVLAEPQQEPITRTFWAWAEQTPACPAILQGPQIWTYAELAERSETLARLLLASGLGRREVVAVYGRSSFGLIAAMMATFQSGGVLLPLDPALPAQRAQRMLREAQAKKLLYVGTRQPNDAWLEEDFGAEIFFIDPQNGWAGDVEAGTDCSSTSLPELGGEDPAYIFFTSGTTGVPKGVLGCHKGLSHFLAWQRNTFGIGPGDRSAQLASLSFDAVLR
ncbi:MAG: condensation domain-containing protein, partial [Candidatus Binatia bacterium]